MCNAVFLFCLNTSCTDPLIQEYVLQLVEEDNNKTAARGLYTARVLQVMTSTLQQLIYAFLQAYSCIDQMFLCFKKEDLTEALRVPLLSQHEKTYLTSPVKFHNTWDGRDEPPDVSLISQ